MFGMPWQPLPFAAEDESLPPLLVSWANTVNSYSVYVTDLTYIWSESLDRRGIIKKSLDENTSIDPSEDADQMRRFLDKLKLGIKGEESTTLSLKAGEGRQGNAVTALTLTVTATLPAGFGDLVWPINLALGSQEDLAVHLTIPLLRAQHARLRELHSMIEILEDKDHVIQKLADKVETMGAELGHIFAGAAPKRGMHVDRKWQEERVRGLGPFDTQKWKKLLQAQEGPHSLDEVVNTVFDADALDDHAEYSLDSEVLPKSLWWDNLEDLKQSGTSRKRKLAVTPTPPSRQPETKEEDIDDFQVQATPPHLIDSEGRQRTPKKSEVKETSSGDEDDLDGGSQSQKSIIPDTYQTDTHKPVTSKKLGTIGKAKQAEKQVTPEPPSRTTQTLEDEDTATEDEDAPSEEPESPPKRPSPAATKPKKGGIGKIGGKKKEASPSPVPPQEEISLPERRPKNKLGKIGHRDSPSKAGDPSSDGAESRPGKAAESSKEAEKPQTPEPEETAEEKANRKREELKRQLEEKAKAPAKKKRKF